MTVTYQCHDILGISFVPRKTIKETQYISVEVGGSATLYCISNHPNSSYAWKCDGSPVQVANHSKYSFTIDGVLQIHDVVQTDGGLYNCSATAVYPGYGQHTRNTTTNLTVYSELFGVNQIIVVYLPCSYLLLKACPVST